ERSDRYPSHVPRSRSMPMHDGASQHPSRQPSWKPIESLGLPSFPRPAGAGTAIVANHTETRAVAPPAQPGNCPEGTEGDALDPGLHLHAPSAAPTHACTYTAPLPFTACP